MSLIAFHRLLITIGILFCGGFALWELFAFLEDGGVLPLLIASAFAAAAVLLGYYLRHLPRFLHLPEEGDEMPR